MSSKLLAGGLAFVFFALAGCATEADDGPRFVVSGVVTAGPTCPVIQDPPDPQCADRPVEGARLVMSDANGDEVTAVTTGAGGAFSLDLAPGRYSITPQPVEGLLGTADPVGVEVIDTALEVNFSYDTGIR